MSGIRPDDYAQALPTAVEFEIAGESAGPAAVLLSVPIGSMFTNPKGSVSAAP